MTTEYMAIVLEMLKVDLGISTDAYDNRFSQYIDYAVEEITREGITLDASAPNDLNLIAMYSAWLWRKRDSGDGMPRMLRYALNNKLIAQKLGDDDV